MDEKEQIKKKNCDHVYGYYKGNGCENDFDYKEPCLVYNKHRKYNDILWFKYCPICGEKIKDGESLVVCRDIRKKEVRNKYGFYKHVFLTVKQYDNLIEDFGKIQLDEMIKILDEYLQMKGAKYKDHNLVLRGWVLKEWNK